MVAVLTVVALPVFAQDAGIPSKEELKKKLTPLQYEVTQNNGTEPPFKNAYWNNKKPGIYVDIVSGEPLFSSKDKFDSGTGWPSFTKPLVPENVVEVPKDGSIDVRSKVANSHLGDKFHDEISQLEVLAVGTLLGLVRDIVTEAVPENMERQVEEIIDGITVKLGGQPLEGRILPESSRIAGFCKNGN